MTLYQERVNPRFNIPFRINFGSTPDLVIASRETDYPVLGRMFPENGTINCFYTNQTPIHFFKEHGIAYKKHQIWL